MQAVILAAGRGLRLRPLTETTPKALVDICGTPLIERTIASLPEEVTEVFVVVGHLKQQIVDALGESIDGRDIRYVTQETLDGTGSALHLLREKLHGKFLVVNGDDLYAAADLERMIAHPLAILVSSTETPVAASALRDPAGRFEGLESNAPEHETKLRVCGAYVLDDRFFDYPLAEVNVHGSVEYSLPHTLVEMSADCDIRVEEASKWYPVGTPEELDQLRAICG